MLQKSILLLVLAGVAVSGCTAAPRVYQPDELPAVAPALLNKNITVEGITVAHAVVCTRVECPDASPCCNTCGSPLALAGEQAKIRLRGSYDLRPVGCFGNECNQTCYPLSIWSRYQVDGILRDDGQEYYLEFGDFRNVTAEMK